MNKKSLDYDTIVENALRIVVKKSLEFLRDNGFSDNHHFYISFNSKFPGVTIPPELLADNIDNEIKIILQHQFWNLKIDDEKFSVTLSFNNKKKNIVIPFNSIFSFSDPSVGFSLQFKKDVLKNEEISEEKQKNKLKKIESSNKEAEIFSLDAFRSKKKD